MGSCGDDVEKVALWRHGEGLVPWRRGLWGQGVGGGGHSPGKPLCTRPLTVGLT